MRVGTISIYDPVDFPETNKFIFLLTAYHVRSGKQYPKRVKIFKIGYFESLKSAENYITEYCLKDKRGKDWGKALHHFEIEKLPFDSELQDPLGYWIYHKNGSLFQSYPDTQAPFLGVGESDRKFHELDIVEVMAYGKLELGIIVTAPRTPEEVEKRKKRCIENNYMVYENNFTDFVFNTITYGKGITVENVVERRSEHFYDHTHGLNIFPISNTVSEDQKKVLEDLYHLFHAPHEA